MNEHLQELKLGGRPMTKLELANKEIERLNKELEIYKLRNKLALKKLNSAMKHYDTDKENNAIIFTKQILEGQGIEEKCHKMLRGDKE